MPNSMIGQADDKDLVIPSTRTESTHSALSEPMGTITGQNDLINLAGEGLTKVLTPPTRYANFLSVPSNAVLDSCQ